MPGGERPRRSISCRLHRDAAFRGVMCLGGDGEGPPVSPVGGQRRRVQIGQLEHPRQLPLDFSNEVQVEVKRLRLATNMPSSFRTEAALARHSSAKSAAAGPTGSVESMITDRTCPWSPRGTPPPGLQDVRPGSEKPADSVGRNSFEASMTPLSSSTICTRFTVRCFSTSRRDPPSPPR